MMIVAIQGSRNFNDYQIFLRAIGSAMSSMKEDDDEILIYSAGVSQTNMFAQEFVNISERSLKARGKKIKLFKIPPSWISKNIHSIDYFIYLCRPKESLSDLVNLADSKDVEVGVYRY
jgi:hypothetical protein